MHGKRFPACRRNERNVYGLLLLIILVVLLLGGLPHGITVAAGLWPERFTGVLVVVAVVLLLMDTYLTASEQPFKKQE